MNLSAPHYPHIGGARLWRGGSLDSETLPPPRLGLTRDLPTRSYKIVID
jgi:hypothetical protein